MKQLPCLRSMTGNKHWVPEQEAEPGTEVKAGELYLVSGVGMGKPASRVPVQVKVYRSAFGHYAVVSAGLRAPATFLNLRTCQCRPCTPSPKPSTQRSPLCPPPRQYGHPSSCKAGGGTFRVELGGGEGQVIYFEVSPREDHGGAGGGEGGIGEWVEAFQGAGVPSPGSISPSHSPVIPRSPIMPTLQESLEEEEEISGLG
ncbi:uncharacterized protein LOC143283921 [Babylonia areolata]|uniref:uncharacterized protein LOC143283921 n=1 Tax=Babylonia areolata TaxID=304850 RepID=UPI003FD506D4